MKNNMLATIKTMPSWIEQGEVKEEKANWVGKRREQGKIVVSNFL
jgi:hypothetical protein